MIGDTQTLKTSSCLTLSRSGAVGHIRLDRPEVLNAFNGELIDQLVEAAAWFDRQHDVKVVIVSGEGKSFCSGFDLKQFSATAEPEEVRSIVDAGRRMVQAIAKMQAITISAVHGNCIGGGFVLALACDFRYAARSARFKLPETDIGIPLAWGGVPWLMREVGPVLAADLILSCREVTAAEAHGWRLLNDVLDDETLFTSVADVAERLCRHAPMVLKMTKAQIAAAKQSLCSDGYAFTDAHVLYSALLDTDAANARHEYLKKTRKKVIAR